MKGVEKSWAYIVAIILLAAVPCFGAAEAAPEMPIVAWGWPFGMAEADVAHYRLVRDCGCNVTIQYAKGVAEAKKCLDAAQKAGVRLLLHNDGVLNQPEKAVPQIKGHPALCAYYLTDEPSVSKMPALGAKARRIRALDPAHPVYMNWFGIVDDKMRWYGVPTFDEYLDTSIREVPTGLFTFDVYPVYAPRFEKRPFARASDPLHLRKDWYASLEAVSLRSRRTKTPFWAFAAIVPLRNHPRWDNPMPTVAHLRLQQYSNLAYGAQGLQYYDFRPSASSVKNYATDEAPLSPDGKISPSYWRLAEVNRELQARAWVFLGSEPVRIRHTGTAPEGTMAYDAGKDRPSLVTSFAPDGELLVSELANGARAAFVVVNRDLNAVSAFAAKFRPGVERVCRDGRTVPACDGTYPMDAGDAEIFVWNRKAKEGGR